MWRCVKTELKIATKTRQKETKLQNVSQMIKNQIFADCDTIWNDPIAGDF